MPVVRTRSIARVIELAARGVDLDARCWRSRDCLHIIATGRVPSLAQRFRAAPHCVELVACGAEPLDQRATVVVRRSTSRAGRSLSRVKGYGSLAR